MFWSLEIQDQEKVKCCKYELISYYCMIVFLSNSLLPSCEHCRVAARRPKGFLAWLEVCLHTACLRCGVQHPKGFSAVHSFQRIVLLKHFQSRDTQSSLWTLKYFVLLLSCPCQLLSPTSLLGEVSHFIHVAIPLSYKTRTFLEPPCYSPPVRLISLLLSYFCVAGPDLCSSGKGPVPTLASQSWWAFFCMTAKPVNNRMYLKRKGFQVSRLCLWLL